MAIWEAGFDIGFRGGDRRLRIPNSKGRGRGGQSLCQATEKTKT